MSLAFNIRHLEKKDLRLEGELLRYIAEQSSRAGTAHP